MNPLPPSIPPDFWPKVPVAYHYRSPFQNLRVEIPAQSEDHVLTALSNLIHEQMETAGEWAAQIDSASASIRDRAPREKFRSLVEDAARLLSVYEAVYNGKRSTGSLSTAPDEVKASAIRRCQAGFVNERFANAEQDDHTFNDPLYSQVNGRSLEDKPGFSR